MLAQTVNFSEELKSWHPATVRAYYNKVHLRMARFLRVLDNADAESIDSTIDLLWSFTEFEQAFFALQDAMDGVDDSLQR